MHRTRIRNQYDDENNVAGSEKESTTANIVLFDSRPVGPPHIGLCPTNLANKIFDKILSFRSYQLIIATDTRLSPATADVTVHIKNLNLTLRKHVSDGSDQTRVFDFLTRIFNETDMRCGSQRSWQTLPRLSTERTLAVASKRGNWHNGDHERIHFQFTCICYDAKAVLRNSPDISEIENVLLSAEYQAPTASKHYAAQLSM